MVFKVEFGAEDNVPFVQIGEHQLRLDMEDLDEHHKERAKNELRETEENVENGLCRLRELLQGEKDLHIPLDDDKFLIKFLRPCKYYPESTFRLIKRFYKFKLKYPKIGMDLTPNHLKHVFDSEVFVFLPTRTPCGARIMIINAGTKWHPKEVSLQDMFRAVVVALEIAMMEPKTQVGGSQVIINMEGFTLMHVYQFSPSMAKQMVEWVQECIPVRLKGIHIVNQSFLFNMVYGIFKPFLGDKLKKRIFTHGSNKKSLCERIPAQCLPERFGGSDNAVPEYPGNLLSEMLYHYEDTFKLFNTYCYSKEKAAAEA